MFIFTKETLTDEIRLDSVSHKESGSITVVLRDRLYILSVFLMGMIYITSSGVFNLLSFYAGHNFGIPENQISYVFTVNAAMCVTMQLAVIRMVRRQKSFKLMALSAALYTIGCFGIALMDNVPWYCLCMAVMTCGELMMTPTMSGLAADLAPVNARGRYMSILSLARPFGQGIGPALLGLVNDSISPRMMWVCGAVFAGVACIAFSIMNKRTKNL